MRQRSGGLRLGSQPGQTVLETLSQKYPSQKRAGGVAQGEVPHTHKIIILNFYYIKKKKDLFLMFSFLSHI
jgi:hypothetical protein